MFSSNYLCHILALTLLLSLAVKKENLGRIARPMPTSLANTIQPINKNG